MKVKKCSLAFLLAFAMVFSTIQLKVLAVSTDRALLIQDALPWGTNSNSNVLDKLIGDGHLLSYDVRTAADAFSMNNLSDYKIIIFANDQSPLTYQIYNTNRSKLEAYANSGGVIVFGACDGGWNYGQLDSALPGGVVEKALQENYNYIVDTDNPIVTGELSDNIPLVNEDLQGNFASHTVFFDESSLPTGTNIILRGSGSNFPTLIEYTIGSGHVIASGLTWEFSYYYGYRFATKAYDDLMLYALKLSNASPVDNTVPQLSNVTIASNNTNSAKAKVGDTITLSFTSNEAIATPTVTIAGHTATITGADTTWTAAYTMTSEDAEGPVGFNIAFSDLSGNAGTAVTTTTNSSTVIFDKTKPVITLNGDQTITLALGSIYNEAGAVANDNIDGDITSKISIDGTVNANAIGTYSVKYNVKDSSGNAATEVIRTVKVIYSFNGILKPINNDGSSVFKLGSTIPVKFQLIDINNNYISTAIAKISYVMVNNDVEDSPVEAISTSAATEGNLFRYDVSSNQYIFNLNTKTGFTSGTYNLTIHLNDGEDYSVQIGIK